MGVATVPLSRRSPGAARPGTVRDPTFTGEVFYQQDFVFYDNFHHTFRVKIITLPVRASQTIKLFSHI